MSMPSHVASVTAVTSTMPQFQAASFSEIRPEGIGRVGSFTPVESQVIVIVNRRAESCAERAVHDEKGEKQQIVVHRGLHGA